MLNTKLPIYGIMILLSLLSNIVIIIIIYKKYNFTKDEIVGALVYENLGIIFGAKIFTYIQNYNVYDKFNFFTLSLSSYGAVSGAIICLVIFGLQFKKNIKDILYIFTPSMPLMYAIGKIGCFLVGCCYGNKYSSIGSITYKYSTVAPNNVNLFPVQLLESIVFILIFIYLINKMYKNKYGLETIGINFIVCGFSKLILDYFRMSHTETFISLNQIISIVIIIIGIFIYIKNKKMLLNN
ncbi:MAG: prolipoprotein diacylglyceryl transferase family protein [Bacilli bacterium]